jgi:hypothetical protein
MFEVVPQTADRHVVVPDLHGEHEVLAAVVDRYIDIPDVQFVFLGDVIDRRGMAYDPDHGVRETVELIRQLGERAVMVIANHEWAMLAAMLAKKPQYAQGAAAMWLGLEGRSSYEANTLNAYGDFERDYDAPGKLQARMEELGHFAVFASATPYFETKTFIATHAGVHPTVEWEEQQEQLVQVTRDMAHGIYFENPQQWFSIGLALSTQRVSCTDKTVVSGHAHYLTSNRQQYMRGQPTSPERSLYDGRRIRLASQLNPPYNDSLFVWQDWNGKIIEIPRR